MISEVKAKVSRIVLNLRLCGIQGTILNVRIR